MTNSLHRKKYGLAYVLTLIMSGVFLLNIFCGFGLNLIHQQREAPSHQSNNHSHDDGEHSDGHEHGSASDDNCCDDVTAQFFSQLIKEKVPSFTFQSTIKVLLVHASVFSSELADDRNFNKLRYYDHLPPPFQDHSKQILFQTFLI